MSVSVFTHKKSSLKNSAQKQKLKLLPSLSHPSRISTNDGYYYGCEHISSNAFPNVDPTITSIKLEKKGGTYQYFESPKALIIDNDENHAGPFCIPQELLSFQPTNEQIFKFFFKGTPKEIALRQIFYYKELTDQEKNWLKTFLDYCRWRNFPVRPGVEKYLLRICNYNWRKSGDKGYLVKSFDHFLEVLNWRSSMFPIDASDAEIQSNLNTGVMYWTARDKNLRPLLVIRLKRFMGKNPAQFKRLTVFCFEWAMRYLFVPGLVETCTVLFDVRGIGLHNFPLSSLSDMTTTLTQQYPFRLDKMYIINDSIFIQTAWNIAKQFLTEVQQQKMHFMRNTCADELLKSYAPYHLEQEFGGTRPLISKFYPFPLLQGPFDPQSKELNVNAVPNCWKAMCEETREGKHWVDSKPELVWSSEASEIFQKCNIPNKPTTLSDQKMITDKSPLSTPSLKQKFSLPSETKKSEYTVTKQADFKTDLSAKSSFSKTSNDQFLLSKTVAALDESYFTEKTSTNQSAVSKEILEEPSHPIHKSIDDTLTVTPTDDKCCTVFETLANHPTQFIGISIPDLETETLIMTKDAESKDKVTKSNEKSKYSRLKRWFKTKNLCWSKMAPE